MILNGKSKLNIQPMVIEADCLKYFDEGRRKRLVLKEGFQNGSLQDPKWGLEYILFIQKFANVIENLEWVKVRLYLMKNWFLPWDGLR